MRHKEESRLNCLCDLSDLWHKAEAGIPESQYELANLYFKGNIVPRDSKTALCWYMKAAGQGHPGAQYMVGVIYACGEGVPADIWTACDWYGLAASQGHKHAALQLELLSRTQWRVPPWIH